MRRISAIIVIALSTLLLVSMSSAQQKSQPQTSNPPGQPCSTALCFIQNTHGLGGYQQKSADFNIDGTGTANIINAGTSYQIGGSRVLSIGSPADSNLFVGVGAGANDVAGQGVANTFSGYQAGYSNTSGFYNTFSGFQAGYNNTSGVNNIFSGFQAGYNNTTGYYNTFSGPNAGSLNTTGYYNTFSGSFAGYLNTTGFDNTFSGIEAGSSNTTGFYNTFSGAYAGSANTTGTLNTFFGLAAGGNNTTGSNSIFVGQGAGQNNMTGNNDIYIGNLGRNESNTLRIGGDTGGGPQTAAYIAGIYGSTASSGVPVYINSFGQLGTSPSSLRFKEQVRDMGDSSNALMKLRPVTFLYKSEYANGERTLQYGLIAEEVAKIYPDLVAHDNDGKPYTVRYQYLATMLLNEVQKQYHRTEAQAELIKAQQQEIENLKQQLQVQNATLQQRLSRLEALARVEVAAAK